MIPIVLHFSLWLCYSTCHISRDLIVRDSATIKEHESLKIRVQQRFYLRQGFATSQDMGQFKTAIFPDSKGQECCHSLARYLWFKFSGRHHQAVSQEEFSSEDSTSTETYNFLDPQPVTVTYTVEQISP